MLLTRGSTDLDVTFAVVAVWAFLIGFLMVVVVVVVVVVIVVGGDVASGAGKTFGSNLVGSSDSKRASAIL